MLNKVQTFQTATTKNMDGHFTLGDEELVSEWNQRKIPFSRTKFRRSCAILGTCGNIPDTQGSQRILFFAFICQGSGAQVED